ncbi:MAG: Uma2 family endonuclease [Planctomycetia bacterium]|nr:Uma2 family endonuclease [Planctomycetia bacterium]
MSITSPPPPLLGATPSPMSEPLDTLWRLSVAQYHQMIQAGILTEDDPVELLEGILVAKMPKNPPHRIGVRKLRRSLERVVPAGWSVDIQDPITLPHSEPEPDGTVSRGDTERITDRHPGPDEVALLVEVADATLSRDRTTKKRIYARAQIPVYWIVNLIERQVEVYTEPTGPADEPDYRQRRDYGPAESVPVVLDGQEVGQIPVGELLP